VAYKADVIEIMIALPSDVAQERRIIRDVIHEWNAIHAKDCQLVLMPVAWETHASPEMGERPQAVINRQLLRDSDLLIAVFWTRLGSPTGSAPSGTVEEIEEHLDAGKPALIYFSSAPVRPDSIDSEQYSALMIFKENCKERGLVEEYDNLTEFREKLARNLAQTVIRQFTSGESDSLLGEFPDPQNGPTLSKAAQELLIEASQDPNGVIIKLESLGGAHVQTNNHEFMKARNPRSAAKWRGAVDDLYRSGLVEDRAGKGEVFFMTDQGYEQADRLKPQ
jgi:uncharacterized protein (DUF1330 family)